MFGDGEVEALDGLPEGFDIPQMPEAPQEYSPGLDSELKQKAESKQSDVSTFSKAKIKDVQGNQFRSSSVKSDESTPGVDATFSCQECGKTFSSRQELKDHTQQQH